jgi:hypothetical protein
MEVALAATVLALTLTGMIGVIESGAQVLDLSRRQTTAGQLLHGEIDQLRMESWTTLTSTYTASDPLTNATDTVLAGFWPIVGTWTGFSMTRTITCVQPASNPYPYANPPLLLQVTFTLTWKSGVTGRSYTRNSATYISANGLSLTYQKS